MAEEEVVHTSPATAEVAGSPVRSDYKRKFEDEAPADPTSINQQPDSAYGVPATDSSEAKRPRLEDNLKPDGLGDQNGLTLEKSDEPVIEEEEHHELVKLNEQQTDTQSPPEDPRMQTEQDPEDNKEEPRVQMEQDLEDNKDVGGLVIQQVLAQDTEADNVGTQQVTAENTEADNVGVLVTQQVDAEADNVGGLVTQQVTAESDNMGGLVTQQVTAESDNMGGLVTQQVSAKETLQPTWDFHRDEHGTMTRKMEIPNNKVGVLIGKAGETIRSLQNNSGAKIQITRDSEADPQASTRPVEIIGDLASIEKAEVLIKAVISEADAGGSASFGARGPAAGHSAGVSEQIEMPVPNEKVGLIIGKGGETIKGLQSRSGARIQLIPQHLQEDGSQERIVRITGNRKQTEMASVMIKDVMNQTLRPSSSSGGFNQQANRPRGPPGAGHWRGPQGPPMSYDYNQHGSYPSQNHRYQPPNYGGYPSQQMAPRSNYGPGWEHRPPQSGGGYDQYGGHGHPASGPAHGPGHSAAVGQHASQANYNYGQPQGPGYGNPVPYSHTAPQQSYGHGYDEQKYDNHAPTQQHPYGGSQAVYSQAGTQPGYAPQQQYGKPPTYGVPQGPPTSYGAPRASQSGDVQYQTSAQPYGSNVPTQQPYPYATSGPVQQTYPAYGSAPAVDGYNQQQPASGPGYIQQGNQAVSGYGQPQPGGVQPTPGYVQAAPGGGYGAYPVTQGYTEQTAVNNTGYGYQTPQDSAYNTGSVTSSGYGAPASVQPNYAQPAPSQPTYDQSAAQSGYAAAPASASASYGKTL